MENFIRKRKCVSRAVLYLLKKILVYMDPRSSNPCGSKVTCVRKAVLDTMRALSKSIQPTYGQTSINDLASVPQRAKPQTQTTHVYSYPGAH